MSDLCRWIHSSEESEFMLTDVVQMQGRITEEGIGWARSKRGYGSTAPRNYFLKLGAVRTLLVASET